VVAVVGGVAGGWTGGVAEHSLAALIVQAVAHPGQVEAVLPMEAEFASPMWIFGQK
jgi:hypothetical protein